MKGITEENIGTFLRSIAAKTSLWVAQTEERVRNTLNTAMDELEAEQEAQDAAIAALRAKDTEQDTALASLRAKNAEQDATMAAMEIIDEELGNEIDALEAKQDAQDGRLNALEAKDTQQDAAIAGKVDAVAGKGLSSEDYTTAEKTKLAGIAAGAEVNVVEGLTVNGAAAPITSKTAAITIVGGGGISVTQTGGETSIAVQDAYPPATPTEAGLMSAADKAKLDAQAGVDAAQDGRLDDLEDGQDVQDGSISALQGRVALLEELMRGVGAPIYRTASGNPAAFDDGFDGAAVKSLVVKIAAVQSGSGDPSPENVRPITGWTAAVISRTGKNLLQLRTRTWESNGLTFVSDRAAGTVTVSGTATALTQFAEAWAIPPGDYTLTGCPSGGSITTYDLRTGQLSSGQSAIDFGSGVDFTLDGASSFSFFITVRQGQTVSNLTFRPMVRAAGSASDFEVYNGQSVTVSFGEAGTVYSGTLDVTNGALVVNRKALDLGTLEWVRTPTQFYAPMPSESASPAPRGRSALCSCYKTGPTTSAQMSDFMLSYSNRDMSANKVVFVRDSRTTDAEVLKTLLSGQTLVYELETPATYNLAPTEITTLLGENRITADAGDVTVEYRADVGLVLRELESAVLSLGANV